jgi:hypothetical protein
LPWGIQIDDLADLLRRCTTTKRELARELGAATQEADPALAGLEVVAAQPARRLTANEQRVAQKLNRGGAPRQHQRSAVQDVDTTVAP